MKAIVVREIGSFNFEDLPVPQPRSGEVLIKTAVTGVCRTDLKIIEVGHRDLVLPRIPGEEIVGEIVSVGSAVSSDFIGQRVYVYPGTSCGRCRACLQGAGNLCESMQIMGFHRDGGFADYVVAPVRSIIPIPDDCTFDRAVLTEPLSCCLNAIELAQLRTGEKIGIWGGGPAGTLLSRAAFAKGADPTVIEPHLSRHRYHARALASIGDEQFDVAIVAVGSAQAYSEALSHLNPRGRLVVFSGLAKDETMRLVDFNLLHYKECTIVGAYGCSFRHGVEALELIRSGKVPVDDLISHRMQLENLNDALEIVRNKSGMKILLYT